MLSINDCKKILNENYNLYTDEEVALIREWLYHISDIAISELKNEVHKHSVRFDKTNTKEQHEKESNYLHKGFNR